MINIRNSFKILNRDETKNENNEEERRKELRRELGKISKEIDKLTPTQSGLTWLEEEHQSSFFQHLNSRYDREPSYVPDGL